MSNALYSIYLKQVFELSKTLVIKSDLVIDAINSSLSELGHYIDPSQPETWKYYKNIAGEYHFTDSPMTVVSMDTLETIAFTKENLAYHRATASEYQYGTRYYKELVNRFPDQETLILGILNPIAMQDAIYAKDGDILYYAKHLVEENEYDLIPRLQRWIKSYFVRWNVPAYTLSDDLYTPSLLGILYLQLPGQILNIRLDHCHTAQAHSYHIREYLASHGKLDVYMDFLTKKQALWLYRNIRYIHRNVGKRETFELLVQNILTERGFPLAAYEMRHELSPQPTELLPEVELVQRPINLMHLGGRNDKFTPRELLVKQFPLAKDNMVVVDETEADINVRMKHSAISHLPTKTLESSVVDMSDDGPYRLSDVLLQNWLYLSTHGRYNTIIPFTNPANGEVLSVSVRDAFTLFLYAFNRSHGITLDRIPQVEAFNVRKLPTPTFAELRNISEERLISDSFILEALDNLPAVGVYISAPAFNEACEVFHARLVEHRYQYTSIEHLEGRGQAQAAVMHIYATVPCTLSDESDYAVWLYNRGLDIEHLTDYDFDLIAIEILAAATGTDVNTSKSLRELQEAMMRLMGQLSSYSVHYLSTINTEPFVVVDWAAIRTGDWFTQSKSSVFAPGMSMRALRIDNRSHISVEHDVGWRSDEFDYDAYYKGTIEYDTRLGIVCTSKPSYEIHLDLMNVRASEAFSPLLELKIIYANNALTLEPNWFTMRGIDAFLTMANTQNNANLSLDVLKVSDPIEITGPHNTMVVCEARRGTPITGQQTIYYNRQNVADVVGDSVVITESGVQTTVDVMVYLNEHFDLTLTEDDISVMNITEGHVTLTMKSSSYLWLGEIAVTLTPLAVNLSDIYINTSLAGLGYPLINED